MYVYEEIYYCKVLAHNIMEAEKSVYLISESWRPRKSGAVQRHKSQRADGV